MTVCINVEAEAGEEVTMHNVLYNARPMYLYTHSLQLNLNQTVP